MELICGFHLIIELGFIRSIKKKVGNSKECMFRNKLQLLKCFCRLGFHLVLVSFEKSLKLNPYILDMTIKKCLTRVFRIEDIVLGVQTECPCFQVTHRSATWVGFLPQWAKSSFNHRKELDNSAKRRREHVWSVIFL